MNIRNIILKWSNIYSNVTQTSINIKNDKNLFNFRHFIADYAMKMIQYYLKKKKYYVSSFKCFR